MPEQGAGWLLEREELAAISGLLDAAQSGRGGVVLVEGVAGVSKLALEGARFMAGLGSLEPHRLAGQSPLRFAGGAYRLGSLAENLAAGRNSSALARTSERPGLSPAPFAALTAAEKDSPARLEHAHALGAYGGALRRAGERRAAREPLSRSLDLALACGAAPLARRAHEELVAAGARPRRDPIESRRRLTASEGRVARLAADGQTNRAIAQALFVTEKTVEVHLTSTYRKLGIASRSQLPTALSEAGIVEDATAA